MGEAALEGVKVLEYASFVVGPYCTRMLADYGADVIKIEKPGFGDEARRRGPFPGDIPHPEKSGLFLYLNFNKKGITLEPKTTAGKKVFKDLVKWADILVEDHLPREMHEQGLDWESLKSINPGLIMTSITPFGQNGSYSDYKAYDLNVAHLGGASFNPGYIPVIQHPELPPLKMGGFTVSYDCGMISAMGSLAAYYGREIIGSGQHVDISMQDAVVSVSRAMNSLYPNREKSLQKFGGCVPCKDGFAVFFAFDEGQWERMCQMMGYPEWTKEERFKDLYSRALNADVVFDFISQWTKDYTRAELGELAKRYHLPAASVNTPEDLMKSEHLKVRGFFQEIDHPVAGRWKYPSTPYIFSDTPWRCKYPAPLLGQHNEEIYCNLLGYSKEDLVRMTANGVI